MKKVVYLFALVLCSAIGFFALGSKDCYAKEKIVFENVDNRKLNMFAGNSYKVELDREELGGNKKITWSSSNRRIATVNKKGKIKAKKPGKAKIVARIQGTEVKASITLKVKKLVKAKKVQITTKKKYVFEEDSLKLKTKITPKKSGEELIWSSSNEDIATVDENGKVTGVSAGKVTITVKTQKSRKKAKKKITVRKNEVKSFRFTASKEVVGLGQTKVLSIKVSPSYVTNKKMLYTSSDPSIATVDHTGKVTGKKVGNVTIKAVYDKNHAVAAQCTVSVSKVKGMLTKQMLDKLNLSSVKNLMIVAHPDDDTLFGGAHLISDKYLVVCMTNGKTYRAADFNKAMDISESERIMLSYPDTQELPVFKHDEDYNWDGCQLAIQSDINLLLHYKKWNTVVTHNPEGEYGHPHHKKLNRYTTNLYKKSPSCAKRLMYFAKYYKKEEFTDAIKSTLPEINSDLFNIKIKMLQAYESKKNTCFGWLWHIQSFEDWVYYEDWKK